jgi:3-oxoacyl-[acyl-carrier protein] reductase
MKIDFTGKKAIVCGGSRGIGKAIALGFAACGGDVSICARDPKALEETRAEIAKLGRTAHAASADLADGDKVRGYVRDAVASLGGSIFWSTTPRPSAPRMTTRVGAPTSRST